MLRIIQNLGAKFRYRNDLHQTGPVAAEALWLSFFTTRHPENLVHKQATFYDDESWSNLQSRNPFREVFLFRSTLVPRIVERIRPPNLSSEEWSNWLTSSGGTDREFHDVSEYLSSFNVAVMLGRSAQEGASAASYLAILLIVTALHRMLEPPPGSNLDVMYSKVSQAHGAVSWSALGGRAHMTPWEFGVRCGQFLSCTSKLTVLMASLYKDPATASSPTSNWDHSIRQLLVYQIQKSLQAFSEYFGTQRDSKEASKEYMLVAVQGSYASQNFACDEALEIDVWQLFIKKVSAQYSVATTESNLIREVLNRIHPELDPLRKEDVIADAVRIIYDSVEGGERTISNSARAPGATT